MDRFRHINFAEQRTGRVYLSLVAGNPVWADRELLEQAILSPDTRAALSATVPAVFDHAMPTAEEPRFLKDIVAREQLQTLGRWGAGI
jgi:hypothetical protein